MLRAYVTVEKGLSVTWSLVTTEGNEIHCQGMERVQCKLGALS